MKPRERILNSILGKEVDRVAWCPFLAYYWDYLDEDIRQKGQVKYLEDIGADPLIRGSHTLAKPIYKNCEVSENTKGNMRQIKYDTPIGTLSVKYIYSPVGNTWYQTNHPVTSSEDFKILKYIYENIIFEENIISYENDKKKMGEDGVYIPLIGTQSKTAFQCLLEYWCGTVDLTYSMFDFPEVVEDCLGVIKLKNQKLLNISVKSTAEGFIFWEDTSTTNISPSIFEKYIKPEIDNWGDTLHQNDKFLIHHACGHLNALMPLISTSKIDVLESISPPPTGNIEIDDARKALPEHIAIIGGIEPTKFVNMSMDKLRDHVTKLIDAMKGQRYILANSDSCPPEVDEDKFRMISELIKV